ncbi:MAG TPA: CYCXC family (seleno)protein [Candidatus Angelobacter sp.]|nr:CYCXC family (seleno)protein [Candidatus Angelobacter sp.]
MKPFFGVLVLVLAAVMTHAQLTSSPGTTPAFHATAPAATAKLPPILTQKDLAAQGFIAPAQTEAYKAAARSSSVFYQMPCYCYCDRNHGHTSLRSCFEGTHGGNCGTCMQEALYASRQSQKGWSPKMIRDGIIRGDFKMVDLQNVTASK